MRKRNCLIPAAAAIGMLVLILDGRTAADGIRQGIQICLQTLIPSLFPFFVLSGILTASLIGRPIPGLGLVGKLCHIPQGCESLLAVGFLGGYPVGAATVRTAFEEGKLTAEEANRLAIFCNNAGPSFLFGILGSMFPSAKYVWCLWSIQIISAILTGFLLGGAPRKNVSSFFGAVNIVDSLNRGIRSMASVCGWVVLFRMVLALLGRWFLWMLDPAWTALLAGFLELSNGCLLLPNIPDPMTRFLVASVLLSAGGLCVLMQTSAVFPGLNLGQYLRGKLIHLILSILISAGVVLLFRRQLVFSLLIFLLTGLCTAILAANSGKRKISVAIPG